MNANHEILNTIEVVGPDQNNMMQITREGGALRAKMTGGVGGGAIVALSAQGEERCVVTALESAGYKTLKTTADFADDSGIRSNRAEAPITLVQKPEDRLIVVNEKDEILLRFDEFGSSKRLATQHCDRRYPLGGGTVFSCTIAEFWGCQMVALTRFLRPNECWYCEWPKGYCGICSQAMCPSGRMRTAKDGGKKMGRSW